MNIFITCFRDYRLSLSISIVALSLWLISLQQARNNLLINGIGDLGLVTILPISYFIAFFMLEISFFNTLINTKNEKLLFFNVFLLIFFLYFTPTVIEQNRFRWSYVTYGWIDYISRHNIVDQFVVWYHNWPSFIILLWDMKEITSLSALSLINLFPIFPEIIYFFPLYSLFNHIFTDISKKWLSIWVFYIGNWISQDYMSPQSFGIFIYLLIISLLFKYCETDLSNPQILFTIIISFISLVTGHFLTSVVIFIIILFMTNIRQKNQNINRLTLIIIMSWTLYGAVQYFDNNIIKFFNEILQLELILNSSVTNRITGSSDHQFVTSMQVTYSLILGLFALIGFYISTRTKSNSLLNKYILISLIVTSFFAALIPYGGEILMRVFLLDLVFLSYYISYNLNKKLISIILILFLILFSPYLSIISHYGTENYQYISRGEISGADFLYGKTISGDIISGFPWGLYKKSPDIYKPNVWMTISLNFSRFEEAIESFVPKNEYCYMLLDRGIEAKYQMYFNATKNDFKNLRSRISKFSPYAKIYDNNDFYIYFK